jgi:DNA-binding response OmpR family regulator
MGVSRGWVGPAIESATRIETASAGLVLMVGDEPQNYTPITEWLTDLGCQVEIVDGGETGLAVIREAAFYLVVVGDFTPGGIGVDIVRAIRGADSRVPIVLISSGSCEVGFMAGRAGADLVFATPIDRDRFEAQAAELIVEAKTRRRQVALFRGLDGHTSSAVVAILTHAKQLETSQRPVQEIRVDLATHLAQALLDELTIFEFVAMASVLRLVNRDLLPGAAVSDQLRSHLDPVVHIQAQAVDPVVTEIVARLEDAGTNCRHASEAQMSSALGAPRSAVWKALAGVGLDFVQIRKAVVMRRAVLQAREDSPVKLVALNLGYEDESHFMHDFSRFFGISLQKFRGLLRN